MLNGDTAPFQRTMRHETSMRRRCKQARMQSLCTCFLPDFLPGYARLLRFSPFCCYLERNSSDSSTLCFCSEPAKPGSPPSRGCVATGFRRKSAKPGSLARGAVPCRLFGMLMLDPCCAAGHAAAKRGQSELDAPTLRSRVAPQHCPKSSSEVLQSATGLPRWPRSLPWVWL